MEPKPPLSTLDKVAVGAAALVAVGMMLPFWVLDFGWGSAYDVSFLDASTGGLAAVLAVGAAILAALRVRFGALIAFAVVGVLVAAQMMDMELGNGLSLGSGAYTVLGGLIVGFVASAVNAARPGMGVHEPAAWVPPVISDAPSPGVSRPLLDPHDPFRIIG